MGATVQAGARGLELGEGSDCVTSQPAGAAGGRGLPARGLVRTQQLERFSSFQETGSRGRALNQHSCSCGQEKGQPRLWGL